MAPRIGTLLLANPLDKAIVKQRITRSNFFDMASPSDAARVAAQYDY
jgi:hypothetical protein